MTLRLLLAALAILLAPALLLVPAIYLFVLAAEYALTGKLTPDVIQEKPTQDEPPPREEERTVVEMPERTVKQVQTKCKGLRQALVAYVNRKRGLWILGSRIVREVLADLFRQDTNTTGEVLAKELRKAQRKGEITKRIRPGTVYVEYTANLVNGQLLDNSLPSHREEH